MHIVHVVRDLDVASGGPSRSVPALAEHQARHEGVTVTVIYQDRGKPVVPLADGEVEYTAFSGKGSLLGEFHGVFPLARPESTAWIVHIHGLWSPILHSAARSAHQAHIPYVISTRGMLANWALGHKALKKKVGWWLYQKKDLMGAASLLVSSEFEQTNVASQLAHGAVAVIPNGCQAPPDAIQELSCLPAADGVRWALAMGRLHPVKGYADLIETWAGLSPPGWKLAIAGPDEAGYRAVLERLIGEYEVADQVFLLGEVDDAHKWSLLNQCELFVAPSKTENFGMAIAEALQAGTPVITTTGTPWRELKEYDCGWWIKPGSVELGGALKEATEATSEVLREKGANGHRLIIKNYSWDQIAERTIALYQSILSRHSCA